MLRNEMFRNGDAARLMLRSGMLRSGDADRVDEVRVNARSRIVDAAHGGRERVVGLCRVEAAIKKPPHSFCTRQVQTRQRTGYVTGRQSGRK